MTTTRVPISLEGMVLAEGLQELWPTGVVLAFIGTFCGALGDVLVRKAFRKAGELKENREAAASIRFSRMSNTAAATPAEENEDCTEVQVPTDVSSPSAAERAPDAVAEKEKSLFLDCCWLTGMGMTAIVDPVMITLALLFAPSSIVTPFAGAHILWACVLAVLLLGERMHTLDVLGAGMVVGGIVAIVVYASKAGDVQTVDDFLLGLKEPEAAICVAVLLSLLVVSIFFACVPEKSAAGHWWQKHVSPTGIELGGIDMKRLGVCTTAGLLGGFTNTATKILALELTRLFEHPAMSLQDWRFYFSGVLTLVFALPQLYFLNTALKHFGAVFVVPTVNACIIVSGSVAAFWILRERPSCMRACVVGLATVIAGVALLSRPTSHATCCGQERREGNKGGDKCSTFFSRREGGSIRSATSRIADPYLAGEPSYAGSCVCPAKHFVADATAAYGLSGAESTPRASSSQPIKEKNLDAALINEV